MPITAAFSNTSRSKESPRVRKKTGDLSGLVLRLLRRCPRRARLDPSPGDRYITDPPVSMKSSHATLTPTSRQRRKDARPQELLDAALDLFVERGFAATRSEDVAA